MGELANSELLGKALAGDRGSWAVLLYRHSDLIWSIADRHRLDSVQKTDVMQIVALRLIERGHQIREPQKISQWIGAVARNECRNLLKSREIVVADPALDEPDSAFVEEALIESERREAVLEALAELPPRCQRLLTLLFRSDSPDYSEIAAELDMPVGSIGPTRARCLDQLGKNLAIRGIREP